MLSPSRESIATAFAFARGFLLATVPEFIEVLVEATKRLRRPYDYKEQVQWTSALLFPSR